MPRALVVFESTHGSTEEAARAIADGLVERVPTLMLPVGVAPAALPDDVEFLVVGGPTHAFGTSRASTRASVRGTGAVDGGSGGTTVGTGLRDWLAVLDAGTGVRGAAFDTHVPGWLHGSAARAIRRCLHRAGVDMMSGPRGFLVAGTTGPLLDGERDRARRWGAELGARFDAPVET